VKVKITLIIHNAVLLCRRCGGEQRPVQGANKFKNIIVSPVIVDIQNLKREFRMGDEIVKALNGVSFTITSGEFITIMGSSGSGKNNIIEYIRLP